MSKESKKNKEQAKKNPTEEEEFSIDVDKAENLKEDSDNSNEQKSKKEEEPKDPLKEALRQAEHWKDIAARNQAELDNYRKRMARDKTDAIKFANGGLLSELLPVIDSFQMGLDAAKLEDSESIITKGMEMVQKQLEEFLSTQGAIEISAIGQPFDPNIHEAISQEANDDIPEGNIITQIRKGYKLHDRLLRAANVIVSKGPEKDSESSEGEDA
ncbi:nucleotide exchange factor GrpE [Verrucomicrobiales bacterium]|nr:nucleotide exchange factor GrpE [Verrucomicrobiales bacterium]MDC0048426.1 nucleotide exchange factor GrpE [Verrucomicrobiota bacterium]NCG28788.1 nucleotide exchange factor GrpE [Verrucomicrobiales bacterium]|tara:strand:+ start:643 stop:1284 length:642 start_codon:yes stop_codon:yes gene_type:complete